MMVDGRTDEELWQAALPLIEQLEELGVEYHVGGSVASSHIGVARMTQDVDLVISGLTPAQAMIFARSVDGPYYVSLDSVRRAAQTRSSFNLLHYATMTKIDIFVHGDTDFDRSVMRRRTPIRIESIDRNIDFASPEDIILRKLVWYQLGNRISDRQWYDLVGVLKVRADKTDIEYLRHWADDQGVRELLERALDEAGPAS